MKKNPVLLQEDINRILNLKQPVEKLTDYHYRIDKKIDLFPVNRRYHVLKTDQRGEYPRNGIELQGWIDAFIYHDDNKNKTDWSIVMDIMSPIKPNEEFPVPSGAVLLDIQMFNGNLCFFYRYPTINKLMEIKNFYYVETGTSIILLNNHYLKTVQVGPKVYHIFGDIDVDNLNLK